MTDIKAAEIAIVGANALYPGSVDKHGFWTNILDGKDLITEIPDSHFLLDDYYSPNPGNEDKIYAHRGGFLPDVEFNPMEFGITPSSIPATDTSQLLALMVAKQVLEEAAGTQFQTVDRDKISVILGVASTTDLVVELGARIQRPVWVKALREGGLPEDQVQEISDRIASHYTPWQEASFPGLLGNVVAGRIANRLDLGGTNVVTDAACASSLSAISMSIMELITHKSDLVISGGVDTLNSIFMHMCFTKTPALSPTSDCRPFSEDADGTLLGEGIGMVALKRLEDAERDNDRIYAVIRGYGSSSDGLGKSVYAPRSAGQAKALRRAYEMAGYGPDTVELVEGHGTGTKAGDLAEFQSLRTVFEEAGRTDRNWCALGSIKSQIGHTKAAAGAASLFKVMIALRHKVLPPTIKAEKPNPKLGIEDSPFYLNTKARPWVRNAKHPRRASVSSFGFGGSNFHMTVEEYTGDGDKAFRMHTSHSELIVLCGEDRGSLLQQVEDLRQELDNHRYAQLWHVARTTQTDYRSDSSARLAIVARDFEEVQAKLNTATELLQKDTTRHDGDGLYLQLDEPDTGADKASAPKTAFLFPGQGSQYIDMTKALAMRFDDAMGIWDSMSEIGFDGEGVHEVVFPVPAVSQADWEEQAACLTSTEWAQPAIGLASLAVLKVLERVGVTADFAGGHSFGELTALRAAGVMDDKSLLAAARRRGELMSKPGDKAGTMTAVLEDYREVEGHVEAVGGTLLTANYNSPKQCVVSGSESDLQRLEQRLAENGIRYARLPVSNAFHSPFVADAVEPFQDYLQSLVFRQPNIPVYSNLDGSRFPEDPEAMKDRLAAQIAAPVRFQQQVSKMIDDGATVFIEVGPSSALSGLVKECAEDKGEDKQIRVVNMDRKHSAGLDAFWQALGRLAAAGVPMNLSSLWDDVEPVPSVPTDSKKKMTVTINGANYGKPYPPAGGSAENPPPNIHLHVNPSAHTGGTAQTEAAAAAVNHAYAEQTPTTEPETTETSLEQPSRPQKSLAAESPFTAAYEEMNSDSMMHMMQGGPAVQGGDQMTSYNNRPQQPGTRPQQPSSSWPTEPYHPNSEVMELQKQVIDAHSTYLKLISESHAQFMKTAAMHLQSIGSASFAQTSVAQDTFAQDTFAAGNQEWPAEPSAPVAASLWHPAEYSQTANQSTAVQHQPVQSEAAPHSATGEYSAAKPAVPEQSRTQPTAVPAEESETKEPDMSVQDILLNLVSEKTGYPADMLDKDADLESGLGIDSIKRVEIFAGLQARIPELPEVEPSQLASLNTLSEIEDFINEALGKKKR